MSFPIHLLTKPELHLAKRLCRSHLLAQKQGVRIGDQIGSFVASLTLASSEIPSPGSIRVSQFTIIIQLPSQHCEKMHRNH